MTLRAGTSGFSYKQWKGSFYPEKLAAKEMLGYYAQHLPAVEINSTFYRMPRASVLGGWCEQVPSSFRFVLKASRRITHMKRLKDVGDETKYLVDTVASLGDRLGALLFQLPPNMKLDLERLERFADLLPTEMRVAFEFRHDSWNDEAVYSLLRSRNRALCFAHVDDEGDAPERDAADALVSTADWGYLRLRREGYSDAELADWSRRILSQGWQQSFVFLKHEVQGPQLAAKLLGLSGRPPARRVAATKTRKVASKA